MHSNFPTDVADKPILWRASAGAANAFTQLFKCSREALVGYKLCLITKPWKKDIAHCKVRWLRRPFEKSQIIYFKSTEALWGTVSFKKFPNIIVSLRWSPFLLKYQLFAIFFKLKEQLLFIQQGQDRQLECKSFFNVNEPMKITK